MGNKPVFGALGLVWAGLATLCLLGTGCNSGGSKPITKGRFGEPGQGAWKQPPVSVNSGDKLPPPSGTGPGTGLVDMNKQPVNGAGGGNPSSITNTTNRPTIMQTSGTTTGPAGSGLGSFEQGTKVGTNSLPGNTTTPPTGSPFGDPATRPGPGTSTLPTYPPTSIGAGSGLQPTQPGGGGGAMIPLPPASGAGRDPITGQAAGPVSIPGAPPPPAATTWPSNPATPSTSGYPPIGATIPTTPTTTTTAPPTIPEDAIPYTPPGSAGPQNYTGVPLPALPGNP